MSRFTNFSGLERDTSTSSLVTESSQAFLPEGVLQSLTLLCRFKASPFSVLYILRQPPQRGRPRMLSAVCLPPGQDRALPKCLAVQGQNLVSANVAFVASLEMPLYSPTDSATTPC